ncbi:MAG: hypothetical protein KJ638_09900, partial [Chloroflexi bacterium]|nr:hypothetical protein [Chloroflexota bacterium]
SPVICGRITPMKPFVVGIQFQKTGKVYHFNAAKCPEIKAGDFVVVETSRGQQLGEVIQLVEKPPRPRDGSWKPILRKATPRDLVLRQVWQSKEAEAIDACRAALAELEIGGVKIISAEYTFDGEQLTLLYGSEGDKNVDLSGLCDAMQGLYLNTQVNMHRIGPRDIAKRIGGMGACGIENRCCSRFLTEFSPISIRMAKAQKISLAPPEITGICGRLRCCLVYEYDQYVEARKLLPREKKLIQTPLGEGRVVSVNPLKQTVLVRVGEHGVNEFSLEELKSVGTPQSPLPKPQEPRPESKRGRSSRSRKRT